LNTNIGCSEADWKVAALRSSSLLLLSQSVLLFVSVLHLLILLCPDH
jgi:hypothetical protein